MIASFAVILDAGTEGILLFVHHKERAVEGDSDSIFLNSEIHFSASAQGTS